MLSCRRILPVLTALALLPMGTGCLARQVTRDGVHMRQALLDMYTDQVMDNLIRAHDNLPFVQVTYGDVTVQDNDQVTGALNGGQTLAEDLVANGARNFVRMFGWAAGGTRSRTMSFVANPVTDQNDIYDAYIEFARDQSRFMVSCDDPGCAAHIVRKHKKLYYWVPVDAGKDFLDLTMKTTFKRGADTTPGAYEVTIVSAEAFYKNRDPKTKQIENKKLPGDLIAAKLTFSAEIPNGGATMIAKLADGRTIKVPLKRLTIQKKDGEDEAIGKGALTSALMTENWSPQALGYTELDLVRAKARIYSHEFPADAPSQAPQTLQRIKSDVNFLRNQQSRIRP